MTRRMATRAVQALQPQPPKGKESKQLESQLSRHWHCGNLDLRPVRCHAGATAFQSCKRNSEEKR